MSNRRLVQLLSLAVVACGGAHLSAAPANASATTFGCDALTWVTAVGQARAVCGSGSSTVVARCVGNKVFVDEVICY